MVGLRALVAMGIACVLGLCGPAAAAGGGEKPDAHVDATGNPFTGGLGYDPERLHVAVGDVVEWMNTDFLVPHTATDDHGLWRLAGDYGDPAGLFPKGFAPGASVSRAFDAGTFGYYCEVHGRDRQHGVVAVNDRIRPVRRHGRLRLVVRWGAGDLPQGQVFDVQEATVPSGHWRMVRRGTRQATGNFRFLNQHFFRSRVRVKGEPTARSGWSPPVGIAF